MQDTRDTQFASPFGADELFHARVRPRQEQRRLVEREDLAECIVAAHRDHPDRARHQVL